MVVTERELREMWRDGRCALPVFAVGTRFSPAAQDFIKDHCLEIQFAKTMTADESPTELPITNYQLRSSLPQLPVTNYQLLCSMDALAALAGLVAAEARRYQLPALAQRLDALAGDCLALTAAEKQGRALATLAPAPAGAGPEFVPGPADHAILHWLNLLRASARQAAAQAVGAGNAKLGAALEQVSAAADGLARQVQSGALGWNQPY